MSSKIVRMLMGASLALGALGVAPALTAHADAVGSDTVTFSGNTIALNCLENCGGAANLPQQGGNGSYSFKSPGGLDPTCQLTSDSVDVDSLGEAGQTVNCNILSDGFYESVLCGTGEADGSASLTSPDDPGTATADYDINFVAGQGVVSGSVIESDGMAILAGTVNLTPTTVPPGNPNCTVGFNVVGNLTVTDGTPQADPDCDPSGGTEGETVPDAGTDSPTCKNDAGLTEVDNTPPNTVDQ